MTAAAQQAGCFSSYCCWPLCTTLPQAKWLKHTSKYDVPGIAIVDFGATEDNRKSPGLRVTLISRYFFGAVNRAAILSRCVLTFSYYSSCLIVSRERVYQVSAFQCFIRSSLLIPSRLDARHLSAEAYTSTLGCCSGRNWSKIGRLKNKTKNNPQTESLYCTCGIATYSTSQAITAREMRHAPCGVCGGIGCTRQQSQAPRNGSRGVFVYSKLVASQQHKKVAKSENVFFLGPSTMATTFMNNDFHHNFACFLANLLNYYSCIKLTYPKKRRTLELRSSERQHMIGLKICIKGQRKTQSKILGSFTSVF